MELKTFMHLDKNKVYVGFDRENIILTGHFKNVNVIANIVEAYNTQTTETTND